MTVRVLIALASSTAVAALSVAPAAAQTAPAATAAATPAPLPAAPLAELIKSVDIPYEEFTLDNGLRVLVHTDRKAPVVAVSVWYDVGSKHEPTGKTGFAHLFEHIMFNGTENAPGDYFEPLRQIGATDLNGTTSFDRTNYFQTVPTAALDVALFLESDRMGYLLGAVTQEVLDNQRGVVQNEKRQGDTQPYGLVRYKMTEGLFPVGHPYRHSVIGSMADLSAADLDDVKTFFRTHYGPNNAVIVLAGDIDVPTARAKMQKYFGAIPRGPETVEPVAPVPTLAAPVSEVMKDNVRVTRIYRMWAVPGLRDADAIRLDAAASVLGGLSSSRLQNTLVRDEQLAVSVSAFNQSLTQVGMFGIAMDVRPGVDVEVAAKRLDALIADFIAKGPTQDEIQRVATSAVSSRIAGLESVGGFGGKATALASGALFADDPELYKRQLAQLAALRPAEVRQAANKWLSRPVYALTVEPGEREAYEEATIAPVTRDPNAAPEQAAPGTRGALPAVEKVAGLDFPDVERARLSNGIEIVYARQDAVPTTQMVLSFDAGIAADPAGKLGTQALTLAVMDEGTTTRNSLALAEAQERLGARIGAGASEDRTFLSLYTPSPNLASSAALLADIARNPAFAPAEVDRLRQQTLARIAQELSSPAGMANRVLPGIVYGEDHPYAKTAAGSGDPAVVGKLTRDDLIAWQQAWIRPEKAKIFVTSDRPLAEVRAVLEQAFGNWRGTGTAGTKAFSTTPPAPRPRIVLIDRPGSPQSLILGGQLTGLDAGNDILPALTSNQVLGSGFLSRINMNLREDKGWSYGSRGGFTQLENAVPYLISAPVQADRTGDSIVELRREVSEFLSNKGVTPVEFTRTINGETRQLAGSFETSGRVLSGMQQNDLYGRPDNYYDTVGQKYLALTPQQLDQAARAALDPNKFVWVVVGEAAKVRPQLDKIGLPVEVVTLPGTPAPAATPARPAAPAAAAPRAN